MNYIDILIIVSLAGFVAVGVWRGFFNEILTLIGFILASILSFIFYSQLGQIIYYKFQILPGISNLISFLLIFLIFQIVWTFLSSFIYKKIYQNIESFKKLDKVLGSIPGFINGSIIISLVLLIFLIVPISPNFKSDLADSRVANFFLNKFAFINNKANQVFAPAADEAQAKINNLTTSFLPESDTQISFPSNLNLQVDEQSEIRMIELVNAERARLGLKPLIRDQKLTDIARKHSEEMFQLSYFDHNSPITGTPFDRLSAANIKYLTAGENIAYAPNVDVAHIGLMNSPKHRDNILEPNYGKIGIGIINAGYWGEMFSQEFTD